MSTALTLRRFRVETFRSVADSNWIDVDRVTALIGTNESGKTNLLVPLWKLNPAKNGEIEPLADYPRKRYNEIRLVEKKPIFIRAEFQLSAALEKEVASLLRVEQQHARRAIICRDLGGKYYVEFPDASGSRGIHTAHVLELITGAEIDIKNAETATKGEESLKAAIVESLVSAQTKLQESEETLDQDALLAVKETLATVDISKASKRSLIAPRYRQLTNQIDEDLLRINEPRSEDTQKARTLVYQALPSFVYYSNYGNLDSEIYLPHVIDNLTGC